MAEKKPGSRRRDTHATPHDHRPGPAHETDDRRRDRSDVSRTTVVGLEKEEHGGIKVGSAFFGWLTATGMTVLLTALAAAAGTAIGVAGGASVTEATETATGSAETVGLVGGIVLLAILFAAYYCGGYVAGRMARFDGLKQGLMVWVWAIVIALIVAGIAAVAGSQYDVLSTLNSFPRLPVDQGAIGIAGLVALIAVVVPSLVGALLGGLAGMRFHRKVDKTGLGR